MHSIAKIFDIVEYLKKSKNQKFKKKERIGKIAQKGPKKRKDPKRQKRPKGQKGPILFLAINPQNKTKKISIAKLNSVQWLERYSW